MLKRILKSWKFWVCTLVLAIIGGGWLYLSRNPNFIEDLRSRINRPQDLPERFSEGDPELTVKITCTKDESSLYITSIPKEFQDSDRLEAKLSWEGIDIFSEAGDGDYLIGICANEECSEINHGCQLHRIVAEE